MFSDKLKMLRNKKDLSQAQMAKILGTAQTTYSGWENNKEPKYEMLKKIANYFNVSIDYLLDNDKYKNTSDITKIERELPEEEKKKLLKIMITMYPDTYKKIKDAE